MVRLALLVAASGCAFEPGALTRRDASFVEDVDAPRDGSPQQDATPVQPPAFVQEDSEINASSDDRVGDDFSMAQTAGNTNIVVVSWTDGGDTVQSITDTRGNTYTGVGAQVSNGTFTQRIYVATNIAAGMNSIEVRFTGNVPFPKIRLFEYSGIDTTNPVIANTFTSGIGTTSQAGPVNVTAVPALVFSANVVSTQTTGPGPDYTERQSDDGDLVQDRIVTVAGSYSASAPLSANANWIMHLVALRGRM